MNKENQITIPLVEKLIDTVSAGLCFGKGVQEPAESAAKYAEITDGILTQAAQNCLEVLKEMKSPGCEFLYLIKP